MYSGVDMTEIAYTAFEMDKDNSFKISSKKENDAEIPVNYEEMYEAADFAVEAADIAVEAAVEMYEESQDDTVFSHSGI